MTTALYLGLMSGTSMDGVDAALCEFSDGRLCRVLDTHTTQYPDELRAELLGLQRGDSMLKLHDYARLDQAVAHCFAETALPLCKKNPVYAIGSHGQTVFHDPNGLATSLQLGNPSLIAARTGVTTVADFRRADMAHGGQGAPLVPAFHHATFAAAGQTRCVVNIGGIANITLLTGTDADAVRGWDTGPGNALMDEWIQHCHQRSYDAEGAWAGSGAIEEILLRQLLGDAYFAKPAPKSTGRDHFNLAWAIQLYPQLRQLPPANVQRTFCELTARSIADAVRSAGTVNQVLLCGGGVRNTILVTRLGELLPKSSVQATDAHGLAAGSVEAAAFAWLAQRRLANLPGALPAVTGAQHAAVLGGVFLPYRVAHRGGY